MPSAGSADRDSRSYRRAEWRVEGGIGVR